MFGFGWLQDRRREEMARFPVTRFVIDIWPGWFHAQWDRNLRDLRDRGAKVWAARGSRW